MKNRLCALFFGFLFLGYSVILNAGAYDQLLGMSGGSVPSVPEPSYQPVADSNDDDDDNNNASTYNKPAKPVTVVRPESLSEKGQRLRREIAIREAEIRAERLQIEAQQAREAERIQWEIEAQKRQRAIEAAREAEREQKKEDRKQAELEKKERANKHLNKYVPPAPVQRAVLPSLKPPVTTVKKGNEARAFSENKFRIATLLRKTVLSEQEKKLLEELYDAQIKLYKQSLLNESLTAKERASIKLELPVINPELSGMYKELASKVNNYLKDNTAQDKNTVDFIQLYNVDKMQQLGEYRLVEAYENVGLGNTCENMLGALKISAAIAKKDISLAGKETLDFIIGRLAPPQAAFAVEGGRIYSTVAFKALDDFMVKAMGATGKTFETKEFWKDLRNEMNVAKKVVMEFIGGPNEK